jgi:hypothetical protein
MNDINAWKAYTHQLLSAGGTIFANAEIPVTEEGAADIKILGLTLLARTLSHTRGVLTLVDANRVVEARTITRCCFENLFWVSGLIEEGKEFRQAMLHDEIKRRTARGKFLFESRIELTTNAEQRLRDWIKEHSALAKSDALNPKQVAALGPVANSYIFYAQLSSDSAHPSIDALNRYVVADRDNEIRALDLEPVVPDAELVDTLSLACMAVLGVLVGVNQLIGGTNGGKDLRALSDEYKALSRARKENKGAESTI